MAGMAGADGSGGSGTGGTGTGGTGGSGTGGTGGGATLEEACAASCAAQAEVECFDSVYCPVLCETLGSDSPECEPEWIAYQECYAELETSDFECVYGMPYSDICSPEETEHFDCLAALPE